MSQVVFGGPYGFITEAEGTKKEEELFLSSLPTSQRTHQVALQKIWQLGMELKRKIEDIDVKNASHLNVLLNEEVPELSAMLGRKATHFDLAHLFAELLKLMIESKKQDRIARHDERLVQLERIQETIDNFKKSASMLFTSAIIGCVLNILAPAVALAGFTRLGKVAIDGLGTAFNSFQNLKPENGCEKISKMVSAAGQAQTQISEVQKVGNEGDRFKSQQFSEMARTDSEESTRNMEEQNQNHRTLQQEWAEQQRREYEVAINTFSRG